MFLTKILDKYNEALSVWYPMFAFQLSLIVEEILKEVKPISIYLVGSFGRDEGSISILNGEIKPLRDYDILLVVDKNVNGDVIRRIRINIHKKLGLPDPYHRKFKFMGFTVWITQTTLKEINAMPLLKFYELKTASKLLWGQDIRPSIRLTIDEISPYNGILILFSKIEGLLGLLEPNIMENNDNLGSVDLIYECMKTYTEIATCLSLLNRELYEPYFLGRCNKVLRRFKESFPELLRVNERLPCLIEEYAYSRLLISQDYLKKFNPRNLLVETSRDLGLAIWYFLNKAYGAHITPLSVENISDYESKFNSLVLEDLFGHYLKKKIGFSNKILSKLTSRLYLRYALLKFVVHARKEDKPIRFTLIFSKNANIMLRLWLIGFLLLRSIEPCFEVNREMLTAAKDKLSGITGRKFLRQHVCEADANSEFLSLCRIVLNLIDLADRVFHRKD